MIKRISLLILYSVGIVFLFVTAVWMNLSSQRLTPWVKSQTSLYLPRSHDLQIQSVTPVLGGIVVNQLEVKNSQTNTEVLKVDRIDISFNIFRMLVNLGIPYTIQLYFGQIDGVFKFFPMRSEFEINEVQPNFHLALRKTNIIQSNPTLTGNGELLVSQQPNGFINFQVDDLKLSGKKKDTMLIMDLPNTSFGELNGKLQISNKKLDVNFNVNGDIIGKLNGSVQIDDRRPERSRLDLKFIGRLEKEYENNLSYLLKPIIQSYSSSNGQLRIQIKGLLKAPGVQKL